MNVYRSKTGCFDGVRGQLGDERGGRSLSLGDVSDVLSLKWFILVVLRLRLIRVLGHGKTLWDPLSENSGCRGAVRGHVRDMVQ